MLLFGPVCSGTACPAKCTAGAAPAVAAVATESSATAGRTIADAIANRLIFKSMKPPYLLELPGVAGASQGPACSPVTPPRASLSSPRESATDLQNHVEF